MNTAIAKNLLRLFENHRIVFWYDAKEELHTEFDTLILPDIEKIILNNNEFGVKYRVLRAEPKQKFLIYHAGPQPHDLENWLLDVLLAHAEFRTDQVGLWLAELGLGLEFSDVVQEHQGFFKSTKRLDNLKTKLDSLDTATQIRLKMLAVCVGSEPRIDTILEQLLHDASFKQENAFALIQRSKLETFLWEQAKAFYGYTSNAPSPQDFALYLFKSALINTTEDDPQIKREHGLTPDAEVFLRRWQDSRQHQDSFKELSGTYADVLDVNNKLASIDFRKLLDADAFALIDQKIIRDLVEIVMQRSATCEEISSWIRMRKQSFWYAQYEHYFEVIENAANFFTLLDKAHLAVQSVYDGVELYTKEWYKIDLLYRKAFYHAGQVQGEILNPLMDSVENFYSNKYLRTLGDKFQDVVSQNAEWKAGILNSQHNFYSHWVVPRCKNDRKLCIIISDAFRYEIAAELAMRIRNEDKFTATMEHCLGVLPSYTQLGMAALLPHHELTLTEKGTVLADGQSTLGLENRNAILQSKVNGQALRYEDIMAKNRENCREIIKNSSVLYIYHNHIDSIAESKEMEVFNAAEQSLDEIIKLIKKLNNANMYNFIVTADHGFLYQQSALDDSDFICDGDFQGDASKQNRRFILGKELVAPSGLQKFSTKQLGIHGDVNVLIPKSVNRLRRRGSSARFVHGGASLQEIVIPVLIINRSRTSDISQVEVEIIRPANTVITSGQLPVTLYQITPVTAKMHNRTLKLGLYSQDNTLISDSYDFTFEFASELPREREHHKTLTLTRLADDFNGKEVFLRLEEKHEGTTHYKEYKSLRFILRRTFTSDFDF